MNSKQRTNKKIVTSHIGIPPHESDWKAHTEGVDIVKVDLEKIKFTVARRISMVELQNSNVEAYMDFVGNNLVVELSTEVAGHRFEDALYPANWKEAFKERWFPKWLLKYFPVVNEPISVLALYPKLPIPPEGKFVPTVHVARMPQFEKGEK